MLLDSCVLVWLFLVQVEGFWKLLELNLNLLKNKDYGGYADTQEGMRGGDSTGHVGTGHRIAS
jgi:hypothetical protein